LSLAWDAIHVWDVNSDRPVRSLRGPDHVHVGAFSPDGRRCVYYASETDRTVRLVEVPDGKETIRFDVPGERQNVTRLAISHDGGRAAGVTLDGWIYLWRLPDPPPARTDPEHLLGTWRVVTAEADGRAVPPELIGLILPTLTFTPEKVMARPGFALPRAFRSLLPQEVIDLVEHGIEGVYHIEPLKSPKTIDITILGELRRTGLGIYSLHGDTLTLCMSLNPDKVASRPTEFASRGNPLTVLATLNRITAPPKP
jgi:uncharacterized protein (TIGR03067 family)